MIQWREGGVRVIRSLAIHTGTIMRTINRREEISLGSCSASASLIGSVTGAEANSGPEIDARVHSTLRDFYWQVGGAQELLAKSGPIRHQGWHGIWRGIR